MDELIGNLKVYELVMQKDDEEAKQKKEKVKSIALKAKAPKDSSSDDQQESDDEEFAMMVRNFKKFFKRRGKFVKAPFDLKKQNFEKRERKTTRECYGCGDKTHLIGDCPKIASKKREPHKAFLGGAWSDSGDDEQKEEEKKDEHCLMAFETNEVQSDSSYYSDNHDDQYEKLCTFSSKLITKNEELKRSNKELEKDKLSLQKENENLHAIIKTLELKLTKCNSCDELKTRIFELEEKLKNEKSTFSKFDDSTNLLNEMLKCQKNTQ